MNPKSSAPAPSEAASPILCRDDDLLRLSVKSCRAGEDQTDSHKDEEARNNTMLILKAVIRGDCFHLSEAAIGGLRKQNRQKPSKITPTYLEMHKNIEDM